MLDKLSLYSNEELVTELCNRHKAVIVACLNKEDESFIHAVDGSATDCYGLLHLLECEMNMETYRNMAGTPPFE